MAGIFKQEIGRYTSIRGSWYRKAQNITAMLSTSRGRHLYENLSIRTGKKRFTT
jgi:hypothetical protein